MNSLGYALVDWIEVHLCHGPGDIEGERITLDDEFAAFIIRAYAVADDGKRKIRRAVLSRPKGRAKSELAAFLAIAEAFGPVRFSHFAAAGEVSEWGYTYTEGEPVGQRVKRPEVLCFATEYGQAGNTYDAVRYICSQSEPLREAHPGIDVGLTRIIVPDGGQITPESAADSSKDGGKSTFVVFDETHLWTLPRLSRLRNTTWCSRFKRGNVQRCVSSKTTNVDLPPSLLLSAADSGVICPPSGTMMRVSPTSIPGCASRNGSDCEQM